MKPHLHSFAPCLGPGTALFFFFFPVPMLVTEAPFLKNSHSLTMSVQLAAFNFIPAKFQSRPSLRPLTLGASAKHPPPPFSPFFRITGRDCTCAVIFNLGGQRLRYVFWKYFKEKQKGSNFLLEYLPD